MRPAASNNEAKTPIDDMGKFGPNETKLSDRRQGRVWLRLKLL